MWKVQPEWRSEARREWPHGIARSLAVAGNIFINTLTPGVRLCKGIYPLVRKVGVIITTHPSSTSQNWSKSRPLVLFIFQRFNM
jgi:hypothetical protein